MLCALQEHFSKRLASYLCMYIDEIYIHTTDEGGFFKMSRTSENLESLNKKKHIYIAYVTLLVSLSTGTWARPASLPVEKETNRTKRKELQMHKQCNEAKKTILVSTERQMAAGSEPSFSRTLPALFKDTLHLWGRSNTPLSVCGELGVWVCLRDRECVFFSMQTWKQNIWCLCY